MKRKISVDGACATGKTTIIGLLRKELRARGHTVDFIEPSRSRFGTDHVAIDAYHVEMDPRVRLLIDWLKMVYDLPLKIKNSEADFIIIERSLPTFLVYNSVFLQTTPENLAKVLKKTYKSHELFPKIDDYLIITTDPEIQIKRLLERPIHGIYDKYSIQSRYFREAIVERFKNIEPLIKNFDPTAKVFYIDNTGRLEDTLEECKKSLFI